MFYEDEVGDPEVVDNKEFVRQVGMDWMARPWEFDDFEPQYIGYKNDRKSGKRQWYWLDWSDNSKDGPQKEKMKTSEVPEDILRLANRKQQKKASGKQKSYLTWKDDRYGFKTMSDGTHAWYKSADSGKTFHRVKARDITLKARCHALANAREPLQKSCEKKKNKKTGNGGVGKKKSKKNYTYEALLKHGNFVYITSDNKYILVASRKTAAPRPRFYERQSNGKYEFVKKRDVPLRIVMDARDEVEEN